MAWNKISRYKTVVNGCHIEGDVTYRGTTIVKWDADTITLDADGYWTVTTKRKLNQADREFTLGYGVYQKAHVWYVTTKRGTYRFFDGMVIDRHTGAVRGLDMKWRMTPDLAA